MPVVRDLGLRYVELSADTEADPMYHGEAYLARWDTRVERAAAAHGITVASLYSGHGSYTTTGLLHEDPSIVERLLQHWVAPTLSRAAAFRADLGFFFHAVAERDLHDQDRYAAAIARLTQNLSAVAKMARAAGVRAAVEQMYSPNQPPWTIDGAIRLLSDLNASNPLYITVDTGHASAQGAFPGSRPADSDPYAWLRSLGPWSPIVHLQQTDGRRSAHRPFTAMENQGGIIDPPRVLTALAAGFADRENTTGAAASATLPEPVDTVYLTLEIFAGTAEPSTELLANLEESVRFWRRWIPEDGLRLSELTRDR